MKKVLSLVTALLLINIGVVCYVILNDHPALIIKSSKDILVSQTIVDHKLPKLYTSYKHTGKPELVVTKVWREHEEKDISKGITLNDYVLPQMYWCKVIDKKEESKKPLWRKVADRLVSLLRFMAFDERGAFLLTEKNYVADNEILPGEYIYLGSLRLTIHVEGQGTLVWEFPGYADRSMPYNKLNSILKSKESDWINMVRQIMYLTATPEQSYKVKQIERGATRQETIWAGVAYDVTLEYIADGINAQ